MEQHSKIYVAGHRGLVGSAIVRTLQSKGFDNILMRSSKELDLRNQQAVEDFFATQKPEYVFLSAAKVGGIVANNTSPAEFIYDNMMIAFNIVNAAYRHNVRKLLFLGSSCIYPKMCPQPIKEEYLLTGALEPTNEAYAIAKISGLELCKEIPRSERVESREGNTLGYRQTDERVSLRRRLGRRSGIPYDELFRRDTYQYRHWRRLFHRRAGTYHKSDSRLRRSDRVRHL